MTEIDCNTRLTKEFKLMKKYDMHVYQCDFYYHHVKKLLFILYWDIFIYGDGDGVILHEVVDKAVGMQRRCFFEEVLDELVRSLHCFTHSLMLIIIVTCI